MITDGKTRTKVSGELHASIPDASDSDPDSLISDPDPAQAGYQSRSGSGSRVLMTKNWKKFYSVKFFFLGHKLQFTYP
jgi:hypothetical protein